MSIQEFIQFFFQSVEEYQLLEGQQLLFLNGLLRHFDSTSELRHWKNMISEITRVFRGLRNVIH